ncbi:hypothetical protein PMAYCL1PPCAC_13273 [Pristionchus mayeri]|uniref:Uncharacterized protein n=1 Tax=Pristionchus mayeri TaxID=1317129 RepID=A0AAN4ZQR8_9BILA|nr:hypothetical protein PMAYCL1PPCAC_13273 [Pristionchus mayeri]
MGVVSWLAFVALVAYRIPTVSCANGQAPSVPVTLVVYSKDDGASFENVVRNVSKVARDRTNYVYDSYGVGKAEDCFASLRQDVKNIGNIYITDNNECRHEKMHKHGLLLVHNSVSNKLTTTEGTPFDVTDTTRLGKLIDALRARVQSGSKEVEEEESGFCVSVFVLILVGVLVCILLAASCFFFQKYRMATSKTQPVEKPTSKSSQRSKSSVKKRKKGSSSNSTSSKSAKKSSKEKEKERRSKDSSRSNKSTSTRTCGPTAVKVVSVPPPTQRQNNACPPCLPLPSKDEVTTVMATSGDVHPVRDLQRRIDLPMTEHEFILAMKKVIEFVIDFYRNPSKYPVSTEIKPNQIFNQLPKTAPEDPQDFSAVWKDFNNIIIPGCVQWQHPRFHAFFPCGRSYPDILAETLISSMGTVGFTWSANPAITELDTAMINWIGRALGIPECFLFRGDNCSTSDGGGWIADTASEAIFCAVMAARHVKIEEEVAKLEKIEEGKMTESIKDTTMKYQQRAEIMSKLVAYGSYESHSSFEKACKMACVHCRPVNVFEQDDWGMRRKTVENEMEKDKQRGLIPFYLHVALGTTSTATSDHLKELTPLKEMYKVWVHVDAAYAGSAWVVEKNRNNEGIDKVDSVNINLHKLFLTSTSVSLFWTRRQHEYKECFRIDPAYLKKKSGANDLRDWGIPLSRRFKSLKVYMLLRMYGLKGMRAYINRITDMTDYMESLIVKLPNIRKFGKTNYGLFCVQYYEEGWKEEQVNAATNHLCEFMNNSHKMVLTHSNVRGHDILRVCITLERTTKKDIDESVAIFKQLLDDFKKEKKTENDNSKGDKSSAKDGRNLQEQDMGIAGSPNLTLSRTQTDARSVASQESLVGPRTAQSHLSVAQTAATQNSTLMSAAPRTDISYISTEKLSSATPPPAAAATIPAAAPPVSSAPPPPAPTAAAPPAPPVNKMPPLPPAFEDPSSKTGGTSSYNAPASAPPTAAPPPETKPVNETYLSPVLSAPEVTARRDMTTDKN